MTMSIISGLSCTQSTGDTTATVANIFQHEQNAARLEVDVFHNPAVYLRESNKYSCPHKSQPLGKKTKLFEQQGVDGHFLYVPINRQEYSFLESLISSILSA